MLFHSTHTNRRLWTTPQSRPSIGPFLHCYQDPSGLLSSQWAWHFIVQTTYYLQPQFWIHASICRKSTLLLIKLSGGSLLFLTFQLRINWELADALIKPLSHQQFHHSLFQDLYLQWKHHLVSMRSFILWLIVRYPWSHDCFSMILAILFSSHHNLGYSFVSYCK